MSCRWGLGVSLFIILVVKTDGLTPTESHTYSCRTFGSGAVRPFNGTLFHVRSDCSVTLTRFTHNRVECAVTTRRGPNGLLARVEITINKIRTVLHDGKVQVEATESVQLPYDHTYQHIFPYGVYTKLRSSVLPLSVVWHTAPGGIDTLWIEMELQLSTAMEGLCGNHLQRVTLENREELISGSVLPEDNCNIWDPIFTINPGCRHFFSYTLDCLTDSTLDYIRLCEENIHTFEQSRDVGCSFFKEVVRQCGNHSYVWSAWRDITHCDAPECPGDLSYVEEGHAFLPSCSNPNADSSELTSACVCPSGLVLDDVQEGTRCVGVSSCRCAFGDSLYEPGHMRGSRRETCLCADGAWKCTPRPLPPRCDIQGQFVTTFDGKRYAVGNGCTFVAAQDVSYWKILMENGDGKSAIKSVHLEILKDKYSFADNTVTFGDKAISDFHESEHALVFWQSSMFVDIYTTFGLQLQIQMSPEIQLYIVPPSNSTLSGLCGNNNGDTTDDFRTNSGIVESSPRQFAQSWSVGPCLHVKPPPPCIRSHYESYAEERCSVLTDPTGVFAACHSHVATDHYLSACVQSTCSCSSHLHQCLCLALSNYAKACVGLGVQVGDWRKATNCTVQCPGNLEFSYNVVACNSTCRSLSGPDLCCLLRDVPVEGCGCPEGTHLTKELSCRPKAQCECHYNGGTTAPGPAVIDGRQCICEDGELKCSDDCGCTNGKVCVHCSDYNVDTLHKTCGSLSKPSAPSCESGCYCPFHQFEDHYGHCVPLDNCTCSYSGKVYSAGESVMSSCKTCVCSRGQWQCTEEPCPGKCQVFGNGHYQTFDSKWYRFDGPCQYIFVRDNCGLRRGTFSVRVESVPCCDEALTCSRSIVLDVRDHFTVTLSDATVTEHVHRARAWDSPMYTVHTVGLYIIITVPSKGITLIWDKHTWVTMELEPHWRNKVCGLCGNFDSNEMNDLQIKDSSVVSSPVVFGNSWKSSSPPCSDVTTEIFPCERHSYCAAWAQRRCRIITEDTFKDCHLKVDPEPYYQACVQESCSCEFEGRYLGFCTAVSAYADACSGREVCVDWRTADLCPVYCDYYNEHDQCVWHYEACGQLLTCGQEKHFTHKLEGCYPRCPEEQPYYDRHTGKCTDVNNCTCFSNGVVMEPRAKVLIDSNECVCQNGTIKCPPPPPPTTTPTTSTSTTSTTTTSTTVATSTTTPTEPPTTATTTTTSTTEPPTTATTTTTSTTEPPTTSTTTTTSPTEPPTTSTTTSTTEPPTTSTTTTTSTTEQPTTSTTTTTSTTEPPTTSTTTTTSTTESPTTATTTTTSPTEPPTTSTTTSTTEPPTTSTTTTTSTTEQPTTSTTTTTSTTEPPTTSTTTTTSTTESPTTATTTTTTPTEPPTTSTTSTTTPTEPPTTSTTTTTSTTEPPTTSTTTTTSTTEPPTTSTTTTTSTTEPPTTSTTTTTSTTEPPTTSTTTTTSTTEPPTTSTTTTTSTTEPPTTSTTTTTSTTEPPTTSTTTSTTEPPTTSTTTTTSTTEPPTTATTTTALPPTTPPCECVNRRKKQKWPCGASWTEDCDTVTCTNGVLQHSPVPCPEYAPPQCPRGLAVNVFDGCCERPSCDCRCELFGDPHYISFQGVTFDFFDDCTYVLVEEQSPQYDLTIAVDNFFCIQGLDGSCVKGVIVKYKGNTATLAIEGLTVQASLNNVPINVPLEVFGMRFETTGQVTTLVLPEIRSYVSLTPFFSLVVSLAMEKFDQNTQGQCGVCGGGSCVRRGGHVEDDSCCAITAYDWLHDDPQKPKCASATNHVPHNCSSPPPPPPPLCPHPLCELLRRPLFAACREHVDLLQIFENCELDACGRSDPCSTLEKAADQCKRAGVCVEWKEHANGSCVSPCSEGLVYKECSPKMDDFCLEGVRHKIKPVKDTIAGCFCPDNQTRTSSDSNMCVDNCKFCLGPVGEPKIRGETWLSNCYNCSCDYDDDLLRFHNDTELEDQPVKVKCVEMTPPPLPTCGPTQVLERRCCERHVCVNKTCSYRGNNYKVGDEWRDDEKPCTSFSCSTEGLRNEIKVCSAQHCPEEDKIWDDEHCCFTCRGDHGCAPVMTALNVSVGQCLSELEVPVCEGLCDHRLELAEVLQGKQSCRFCAVRSWESRTVTLPCSDHTNQTVTYPHVTGCECKACAVLDVLP